MGRISTGLMAILALVSVSAWSQQWSVPAPQQFDRAVACLEGVQSPLLVELADTQAQQARGLMQREYLGKYEGMLFRYDHKRPGYGGFWMYQTLIPLDIAYLDKQGKIVKTFTMRPCGSNDPNQCRSYSPGKPYWSVLEVNAGFFEEHNVRLGDRIYLADENGSCKNKK
ncbi:DUF192 domain-containing protein [Idiomarina sp. 29L]|uniref:DUF192 domain-containing protein n=1 Tax=Idiomarina sp. 29L TaxID=2508877 RepID=UPI00196B54F7|nr:DUF192 domain-containing protein [Idiomarina sp. 29L]